MRKQFEGYYAPTSDELAALWGRGLVVLDANALLNLYRYTETTAEEFLKTLRSIQDRLWLPYQAGLEFHTRRLDVIDQQIQAYEVIANAMDTAKKTIASEANRFKRHPRIDVGELLAQYEDAMSKVVASHEAARDAYKNSASTSPHVDPVLDAVTELFAGRVGDSFTAEELAAIYQEGQARYEKSIPPGFKDARKPEPGRYGDLVIWREMLRKGALDKLPMIFVTDDRKEDWWWEFLGKTVGPRVELVEEYAAVSGARIHFYTPEQFLRYATNNIAAAVSKESIGEVGAVSQQETDNSRARSADEDRLELLFRERWALEREVEHRRRYRSEATFGRHDLKQLREQFAAVTAELEDVDKRIARSRQMLRAAEEPSQLQDAHYELTKQQEKRLRLVAQLEELLPELDNRKHENRARAVLSENTSRELHVLRAQLRALEEEIVGAREEPQDPDDPRAFP